MFAVRDEDVALDIVQDAMLKLTENYADKPVAELPMLFQRILQNAIHDHFRRQKVRSTWTTVLSTLGQKEDRDDDYDPLETLQPAAGSPEPGDPAVHAEQSQIVGLIEQALARLPTPSSARRCTRSSRRSPGFRRVNARRSCCVTGKSSTSRKPPPRWAVPKAA